MKKITSTLLTISLVISTFSYGNSMPFAKEITANSVEMNETETIDYGTPGIDYEDGEVLVQVKDGAGVLVGKRPSANVEGKSASIDGNTFTVEEQIEENDKDSDLVLVKGEDTEELIEAFEDDEDVLVAQPNYIYTIDSLQDGSEEPALDYQWAIDNKLNSDLDAPDMHVKQTWNDMNDNEVVVAVCDTGVDYEHPDLQNMMWNHGLEYSTLKSLGGGTYGINTSGEGASNNPLDINRGHGTHCASVIASEYNGQGTAGITNQVKIMAVKIAKNGSITSSSAINGYNYMISAKKAGINLVAANDSWNDNNNRIRTQDSLLNEKINEAGELGIATIFSAGNMKIDTDRYCSTYYNNSNTIYVGAMDSKGKKAEFSNYGKNNVDVFAPGTNILAATSTQPGNINMPGQYIPWIQESDNIFYEDFSASQNIEATAKAYYYTGINSVLDEPNISTEGFSDGKSLHFHVPGNAKASSNARVDVTLKFQINQELLDAENPIYFSCAVNSFYTAATYLENEDGAQTKVGKTTYNYDMGWGIISRTIDMETLQNYINSEGYITLMLRLAPNVSLKENQEIFIDSIGVGNTTSDYYYDTGTSMAAPMATGLVGLLASKYPDKDIEEIVAMVKGSVEVSDQLTDYCNTGGYITTDAYMDLGHLKPVMNNVDNSGTNAVITGYFFGSEEGVVTVDGYNATIVSWDEKEITIEIPNEIKKSSYKEVAITTSNGLSGSQQFTIGSGELGYELMIAPDGDSRSINEIDLAGNDDLLMSIHTDIGASKVTFQTYDKDTDVWSGIDAPGKIYLTKDFDFNITTASSKHKIFVLYRGGSSASAMRLATYDTREKTWTDVVDVSDIADMYSMLCVYKGELYILGGRSTATVCKVYPDTGETYGTVPDMNQAGGKAKVIANDKYMFVTSYNSSLGQNNIERFDGTTWAKGTYKNDAYSYGLDVTTQFPAEDGIYVIGGARTVEGIDHIVDTYYVDEDTLEGSAVGNLTFNETKLTAVDAASTSDYIYVEGMCDEVDAIKMGRIDINNNEIGIKPGNIISDDPITKKMAEMLSVKFQWNSDHTALRFVSSIDSVDYSEAGFIINGKYGLRTITNQRKSVKTLYTSITANNETIYPKEFCDVSKYFFTYTIRNMDGNEPSSWSVTPYVITNDGMTITGTTGACTYPDENTTENEESSTGTTE